MLGLNKIKFFITITDTDLCSKFLPARITLYCLAGLDRI